MKLSCAVLLLCMIVTLEAVLVKGLSNALVCSLPKKVGICRAAFPRYYFNVKTGRCEKFIYGGCGGNANNFLTKAACVRKCRCGVPKKTGPCKAYFVRYFYKNGRCLRFIYGGCQGNGNNFRSRSECRRTCGRTYG